MESVGYSVDGLKGPSSGEGAAESAMEDREAEPLNPAVGDVISMPELLFVGVKPGYYVLLEKADDHARLGFVDILDDGIAPTGRTINVPRDALTRFSRTTHTLDVSGYPYNWPPVNSTNSTTQE
jgi:hypothetical protein